MGPACHPATPTPRPPAAALTSCTPEHIPSGPHRLQGPRLSGLDGPVLSVLRYVPLSGQTTVGFFTHLLKGPEGRLGGTLVLAVFTETSLDFCVQVFVWTCFQLLWVNTKECDH